MNVEKMLFFFLPHPSKKKILQRAILSANYQSYFSNVPNSAMFTFILLVSEDEKISSSNLIIAPLQYLNEIIISPEFVDRGRCQMNVVQVVFYEASLQ